MAFRSLSRLRVPALTRKFALGAALAMLGPASLSAPITGPLTGQITDWPAGKPGVIVLTVLRGAPNYAADGVLARGTVDAEGRFSIVLPDAAALNTVLVGESGGAAGDFRCTQRLTCNGTLTVPAGARFQLFDLVATPEGGVPITVLLSSTRRINAVEGDVLTSLAFTPAAARVGGAFSSFNEFGTRQYTWDSDLAAGWNWVTHVVGKPDLTTWVWPVQSSAGALPANLTYHTQLGTGDVGLNLRAMRSGGVVVDAVRPGSPAEQAGLKEDDMLVSVDGENVEGLIPELALRHLLGETGTAVKITVRRGDQTLEFTVVRAFIPWVR